MNKSSIPLSLRRYNAIGFARLRRGLSAIGRGLREALLIALVLLPLVLGFVAGVFVAIVLRLAFAAIEGFSSGRRFMNGDFR